MLRISISHRALLALSLAAAIAAGTATPSHAFLGSLFNFGKTAEEPVPDPVPYTLTFTVEGADRKLEKALRAASNLVERENSPPSGLVGLLARARQDVSRLVSVLYENARYAGEVFITVDGKPLEAIGPFDPILTQPVPVTVRVVVGDSYVFGAITASPLPPEMTLRSLGLEQGRPASSSVIVAAEGRIADAWKQQGHPLAAAQPRDTVADHATDTLDVALVIDPGPRANFGSVEVTGTELVNPDLVLKRAGIMPGTPYSSTITRRAETRLRELGVFESVSIMPAEAVLPDGTIPITITVSERKRRVIGGSVTYSNTEGLGLEAYWRHRNLFGGAEQLSFTASVSRLLDGAFDPDYRLAGTFRKPAVFTPMTDFTLRLEGYRQTTEAYRVTALEGEVGLTHVFNDVLSGSLGLGLERSQTVTTTGVSDHLLTTLTGKLEYDTRDNKLDPSEGMRALMTVAPAYDFLKNKPFANFSLDVSAYHALDEDKRFVVAGRAAAAVLATDNINDVAANRRLYLGGSNSVRGYGYNNIAPRDTAGNIEGGRSSVLVSGELRYRLTDQIGLVAFADAGTVSSSLVPTFDDIRMGVGAGVRYLTPVGPIRLDVAVPLQRKQGDPSVGLYVGLGQAF